jgi:sugar phosphate isomerase/epimerase
LRDTVDLAEQLDLAVCLELNSCWAERAFRESVVRAGARLAHVQVSDGVVGSLSTPDRLVPGDGDVPIGARIEALLLAGYPGAFEIEMVGPRIEEEGYEPAIGRAIAHVADQLARVDAAGLA